MLNRSVKLSTSYITNIFSELNRKIHSCNEPRLLLASERNLLLEKYTELLLTSSIPTNVPVRTTAKTFTPLTTTTTAAHPSWQLAQVGGNNWKGNRMSYALNTRGDVYRVTKNFDRLANGRRQAYTTVVECLDFWIETFGAYFIRYKLAGSLECMLVLSLWGWGGGLEFFACLPTDAL